MLSKYLPKPHPLKSVFKSYDFPISGVANFIGKSYPYTCNILSGVVRVTPEVELKLKGLAELLKAENK